MSLALDLAKLRSVPAEVGIFGTTVVKVPKLARDWLCDQAEIADAATAYVAARLANDAAEPKDWTYHAAELERTWRDLCRASGLYEEVES